MLPLVPVSAQAGTQEPPCPEREPAGTLYVRGVNCRVVEIDGYPRRYIVYVPTNPVFNLEDDMPVVFMHHGTGGDDEKFLRISGWAEKAEQVGLVAVFPTGLVYLVFGETFCDGATCVLEPPRHKTKWNEYGLASKVDLNDKPPGYPDSGPWPADDIKFVRTMVGDLEASGLNIDPGRRYVSGFSNGAAFCMRVAVELSDLFAAAGCSAGGLPGVYTPVRKIPVYLTVGNVDPGVVEVLNAEDNPNPPLTAVPLTYDELFAYLFIQTSVGWLLDTFVVSHEPDAVFEEPNELRVEYRTPADPSVGQAKFFFAMQKGVTHQFPNTRNNPEGFNNADRFWDFFSGLSPSGTAPTPSRMPTSFFQNPIFIGIILAAAAITAAATGLWLRTKGRTRSSPNSVALMTSAKVAMFGART